MDIYLTYMQHNEKGALILLDPTNEKIVWYLDDWDPTDNPDPLKVIVV